MSDKKAVKVPVKAEKQTEVREGKRSKIVITPLMTSTIDVVSKLVKDGCTKAEGSREAYDVLKADHERRQIIFVLMESCNLSKFGAATYYQNCKSQK